MRVLVPSAAYMLALKLKALRINDPIKGAQEAADMRNLLRVNGMSPAEFIHHNIFTEPRAVAPCADADFSPQA